MQALSPKYTELNNIKTSLKNAGYCVLDASTVAHWLHCATEELNVLSPSWDDLPYDNFLKDGGRYRRRRHSSSIFENQSLTQVPHRAHWQSLDFNALHGGIERWFEPILDLTVSQSAWSKILLKLVQIASELRGAHEKRWCIESHQFRIDTTGGIGRPTPEGAHRDGVDLVAVFLVKRQDIKGGETRVFDVNDSNGERFTLTEPWSVLLLDDARMVHETTPIQPLEKEGYRDTLVITLRANDFQNPDHS